MHHHPTPTYHPLEKIPLHLEIGSPREGLLCSEHSQMTFEIVFWVMALYQRPESNSLHPIPMYHSAEIRRLHFWLLRQKEPRAFAMDHMPSHTSRDQSGQKSASMSTIVSPSSHSRH